MPELKIEDVDDVQPKEMKPIQTEKQVIPLGYLPIEMSTNGLLGVPKVVHCRNFSTSDLVDISMFNDAILPERIITVLNSMIFEKTDVANWPDKCIIELLVKLYVNFFTPILNQVVFPWNQEDLDWLEAHEKIDEKDSLMDGKWVPRIDLDLTSVGIKMLSENVKSYVTFKKKETGFSAKFISYPRYGDVLSVRKALEAKFEESDRKFAKIKQMFEIQEKFLQEGRDISMFEPIDQAEYMKWQTYEAKKAIYAAKASQALYLVEYRGEDLSNATIDEKIAYVEKPEFDVKLATKINKQFQKLEFGINPLVTVKNPITGERCQRYFTFRLMDILQAIRTSESDEYDISYDE